MTRTKKSAPTAHRQFSLRVANSVFEGLERRTAELAESRNALAERYIAEGLKMDEHPDVYFREGALGRRAAIIGTRLDVWQVIDTVRSSGNSVEDAAEYLGMPVGKVRAAVGYYAAYRNEVDEFAARATALAVRAEAAWRAEQEILTG
jgi:uncharacterized protein (DUF433 family)